MKKLCSLVVLLALLSLTATAQKKRPMPTIGIVIGLEYDSLVTATGYHCIVESIARRVAPDKVSEAAFEQNKNLFSRLKTPVYACNLFIPAELKVVGPAVDEAAVLTYVERVMARLSQTGVKLVIWGSGGARRIPDGFDRTIALAQFIGIGKKIGPIAQKYGIMIALENLNSTETNCINTVTEALDVVKKIGHPNIRLNADIYHMLKEGEAPDVLLATKKYLIHVEIAEKNNRTLPGVEGTDFRPYLRALKKIKYQQSIILEGGWKNTSEVENAIPFLKEQLKDAGYQER